MAKIDYLGILTGLRTIIQASADFTGVPVEIESEFALSGFGKSVKIGLYLNDRQAPDDIQKISNGVRTDMLVSISAWIQVNGLDLMSILSQRDDYLGKLELLLMTDRTIGGVVNSLWFTGGEFSSFRNRETKSKFMVAAELRIIAHASSSN